MQYRNFGTLDWKCSALGFGAMRFPKIQDTEQVDEPQAIALLRAALDGGVNYIDSAYRYHEGHSEEIVGRALRDAGVTGRDRVRIATKLPASQVTATADFDRMLNEQLQRLQTDHIDFYLLHGLNNEHWATMQRLDILTCMDKALADGRILHTGFSFHDSFEVFQSILDAYHWNMCQIQYNYLNEHFQAGRRGLQYAAGKGIAVVVMEPLQGGRLGNPPAPMRAVLDAAQPHRTPADWALRWVWDQPEVSLALSGMSTMEQVMENLCLADAARPGMMTAADQEVIAQARAAFEALSPIPCTACRYCMPCPQGVNIPKNLEYFNRGCVDESFEGPRKRYAEMKEPDRALNCIQCALCEAACPQNIPVSEWMPIVDEVLGQGKEFDREKAPQKK